MLPPALPEPLARRFAQRFGRPPRAAARAPGRVNLIGEHTDYNEGYVLPIALTQRTTALAAPRDDGRVGVWSAQFDEACEWPSGGWLRERFPHWTSYVAGVAELLRQAGALPGGADVLIDSDVPPGSGLSSSAALELAVAAALDGLAGAQRSPLDLARLSRRAEHDFAGVPCGIMDQYVCALASADHAFLLDCRTQTWQHVPLHLGDCALLVVNSGVRHELAAGEYALRQAQCRAAVDQLGGAAERLVSLRDVDAARLDRAAAQLAPLVARRARHVVSENARVLRAADALHSGDLPEFGRLMYASHASLRDDYEVSCRELDRLVEIAASVPGALGARMTGGGFGGCAVVLIESDAVADLEDAIRAGYDECGFGRAQILRTSAGAGVERVAVGA